VIRLALELVQDGVWGRLTAYEISRHGERLASRVKREVRTELRTGRKSRAGDYSFSGAGFAGRNKGRLTSGQPA